MLHNLHETDPDTVEDTALPLSDEIADDTAELDGEGASVPELDVVMMLLREEDGLRDVTMAEDEGSRTVVDERMGGVVVGITEDWGIRFTDGN